MLSLLAAVALAPLRHVEWDTVNLPSSRYSDAVEIGTAKNPKQEDYPSKDPLVRRWTSEDEGIVVDVECAMPAPLDDEGDTISEGIDLVTKHIAEDFKKIHVDGAQSMALDRGGISIRLCVGTDIYGNLRITESSKSPVLYRRTILAKAGRVDDALDILKTLSFRTESGTIRVYEKGFPKGWSSSFGDKKILIPMPQDTDPADTSMGRADMKQWGGDDSYWYWVSFYANFKGSPEDLAKQPFPYAGGFEQNPTVTKADVVSIDGQNVLRVFGTSKSGQFVKDWIAWYARTAAGRLDAVLAVKKPGQSWPKDLPFSTSGEGKPVTADIFGEILEWANRSITFGASTITAEIFGQTKKIDDEWTDYYRDGANLIIQVYKGATAERKWADFDPTGRWTPQVFAKAENLIDISAKKFGNTDWYVLRAVAVLPDGRRGIERFEMVHTKQDGQSFLIWLLGLDVEANRGISKRMMMSIKGVDGKPVLDNYPPEAKSEYFLPYHQLRFSMTNLTSRPIAFNSEFDFRWQGWPLSDGETKMYFSHDRDASEREPGNRQFAEAEGFKRVSPPRHPELQAFGKDAVIEEAEWQKDGEKVTITSVSHRKGASVHFVRKVGTPDTAWKNFVAKTWQ
jgi:hypothetical protein